MTASPYQILVDGLCPLCKREARMIRRMDAGRGLVEVVDITAPAFNPASINRTMDDVIGSIHGVRPDGQVVTGLQVFRDVYARLGRGWLAAWTGWPVFRPICDFLYRRFAKIRPMLSGSKRCEGDRCKV